MAVAVTRDVLEARDCCATGASAVIRKLVGILVSEISVMMESAFA